MRDAALIGAYCERAWKELQEGGTDWLKAVELDRESWDTISLRIVDEAYLIEFPAGGNHDLGASGRYRLTDQVAVLSIAGYIAGVETEPGGQEINAEVGRVVSAVRVLLPTISADGRLSFDSDDIEAGGLSFDAFHNGCKASNALNSYMERITHWAGKDPRDYLRGWLELAFHVGVLARETSASSPARSKKVRPLEDVMAELRALIGLEIVKQQVGALVDFLRVQSERRAAGLTTPEISHHLIFSGPPGTGKTTVARLIAEVFAALELLPEGQVTEVARQDLVGGYVGQTAIKTNDVIERALGGVLFIDEAYALVSGVGSLDYVSQRCADPSAASCPPRRRSAAEPCSRGWWASPPDC